MTWRSRGHTISDFKRTHDSFKQLGIDTSKLYRQLGIKDSDLQGNGSSVQPGTFLELLELASEQENRPILGLEMAQTRDISHLGVLGYLVRNGSNFEQSLSMIDSYSQLILPGCKTGLIQQGEQSFWTYEISGFSPSLARHEVEMTVLQFINLIRDLFKLPTWQPTQIYFIHDAPCDPQLIKDVLGAELYFGHFFNGVAFPTEFLKRPINGADPNLLSILEGQVQTAITALKKDSNLIDRVTFLITSRLGKADASADVIAATIGMSRRTLHRRLDALGTSFNDLRDTLILRIAKETLATTRVSITELALELGYSDASAFHRAFLRLSGQTPSQYRKANNLNR